MKTNEKHIREGVIRTLFEFNKMKDLAKETTRVLGKAVPGVELQDTKSDGFMLRRMKDTTIRDEDITTALIKAIRHLLGGDDHDDVLDYIADNFEFAYDDDQVDDKLIDTFFIWNRSGRIMYVELDL